MSERPENGGGNITLLDEKTHSSSLFPHRLTKKERNKHTITSLWSSKMPREKEKKKKTSSDWDSIPFLFLFSGARRC